MRIQLFVKNLPSMQMITSIERILGHLVLFKSFNLVSDL